MEIERLLSDWQSVNLQPLHAAEKTCQLVSVELQKKFFNLGHPTLVLLGSLGTGNWRVRQVFGSLDSADFDWAMLIDLPSDFDLNDQYGMDYLDELYQQLIAKHTTRDDLKVELQEIVFEQSKGEFSSCNHCLPTRHGWGFNIQTLEQARYFLANLETIHERMLVDARCAWFLPSFPIETNQRNRFFFFTALNELAEDRQKKILDSLVKDLSYLLSPRKEHINHQFLNEIHLRPYLPQAHRRQLELLETLTTLNMEIRAASIINLLAEMREEALEKNRF